jgi:tRNA pseudouridine55 synthase
MDFVNGELILIDKPLNWTSFDVVNKIRHLIKMQLNIKKIKVGHAGTLDPLATGLLIICTGKFTKKIDTYQAQNKEYITTLKLGATTPTFDREMDEDQQYPWEHITELQVHETLKLFIGEQLQVPPMFSAKKVNGIKAYDAARKGETIELKANKITIETLEVLSFNFPFVSIKMNCSKGTYVRAFGRDFGKALNSGAYLYELRRTKIGDFNVDNAMDVIDFEKNMNKNATN